MSRPNIVWVTLDSVRADHTSHEEYRRDTTPNLQRIAEKSAGTSFSKCFSHANYTRASVPSILTGTYPTHHQVGMQGFEGTLPEGLETVAQILSREGYRTGAISRNANASMGIDRGFDRFNWISKSTLLNAVDKRTLLKFALNVRKHSGGLTADSTKHATPYLITDMAERWIREWEGEDEPFYMYLHYNEPHRPYYPPLRYLNRYTEDLDISARKAAEIAVEVHENIYEVMANGCDLSETEWTALEAMYDAELAYTDELVGNLFDYIESRDLGETIFVVTADHGELFGERGMMSHTKLVHDAATRVPLVVHGEPELADAADDLVQHADVLEALVDRAGGSTEQFQGIDPRSESRDFVILQTCPDPLEKVQQHNPSFDPTQFHRAQLTALRTDEFKFQRSDDGEDLFELPDESTDVSEEYLDVAEDLSERLDRWTATYGEPFGEPGEGEFSDAMKDQLKDLGYVMD